MPFCSRTSRCPRVVRRAQAALSTFFASSYRDILWNARVTKNSPGAGCLHLHLPPVGPARWRAALRRFPLCSEAPGKNAVWFSYPFKIGSRVADRTGMLEFTLFLFYCVSMVES
jgi:hypothetical protein